MDGPTIWFIHTPGYGLWLRIMQSVAGVLEMSGQYIATPFGARSVGKAHSSERDESSSPDSPIVDEYQT
jgi:hypothetical protein